MIRADDGELWQRARQGEAECFGVLFDRHGGAVRAFCARRTGSIDAADDLVSIVFLEAWRRRGEVELVDGIATSASAGWASEVSRRAGRRRTDGRCWSIDAAVSPSASMSKWVAAPPGTP
jgi:DNA-directed RNA polymerase specialized sigma24 family protein